MSLSENRKQAIDRNNFISSDLSDIDQIGTMPNKNIFSS